MENTKVKAKKKVSFGMYWQVYGRQAIELPDDIDETDIEAVKAYIREVWDDIPLPCGDYVSGSDELDEESDIEVFTSEC